MKLVVVLLCLFVALASADIIKPENRIEESGQPSEHLSQSVKDVPNFDVDAKESNEEDEIVEEENINELDQTRSDESEIQDESSLKDDQADEEIVVKEGNKVNQ